MSVSTLVVPDYNNDEGTDHPLNIDASINVLEKLGNSAAPHETDPQSDKVEIEPVKRWDGGTIKSKDTQTTSAFSYPSNKDRIDRVVIDESTLDISTETGTEADSPTAPSITDGKLPVCQVRLSPSDSAISNDMITDERRAWFFYAVDAEGAVDAENVTSTYKGNDIDSDGDGVVDDSDAFGGTAASSGSDDQVISHDGSNTQWEDISKLVSKNSGLKVFVSDGTFDVSNINDVVVTAVAAGGGGAGGDVGGGGGSAGEGIVNERFDVSGDSSISITIGSGGSGGGVSSDGDSGGDTSFGSKLTLSGGDGTSSGAAGSGGGSSRDASGSTAGRKGEQGGDGDSTGDSNGGGGGASIISDGGTENKSAPGFGGGGGGGADGRSGGDGGDGIVIVQW